jgi:hypothetical protein
MDEYIFFDINASSNEEKIKEKLKQEFCDIYTRNELYYQTFVYESKKIVEYQHNYILFLNKSLHEALEENKKLKEKIN